MNFDGLLKKTTKLLVAKKKLANLVQIEKKSQKMKNLIEKYNYKTCISSTPNHLLI